MTAAIDRTYQFSVGTLGGPPSNELAELAERLKYDPDPSDYCETIVCNLKAGAITSKIAVSFTGVGAAFRGLLVAVAYFQAADGPSSPLSEDVFRISYQDAPEEITPRLAKWLDACIIEGIAHWRRTLV